MTQAAGVVVNGLSRHFVTPGGTQTVLESVDLDLAAGERIVLFGPSGSGKSTFLNLIAGIDRPDAGDIQLDDFSMTQANERDRTLYRRRNIGFVFQFFNLIPTLTVNENVELPLRLGQSPKTLFSRMRSLDRSLRQDQSDRDFRSQVTTVLDSVGVAHLGSRFPDALSGGEQQRVAVARAMIHKPTLILADEPTGNLDQDNADRVINLLNELNREQGATLILATHSEAAARLADRVLTVEQHRLVEIPKPVKNRG